LQNGNNFARDTLGHKKTDLSSSSLLALCDELRGGMASTKITGGVAVFFK
jgi:hypothetical protein